MEVTEITGEERQAFIDKTQPIYEKDANDIGEDLVKKDDRGGQDNRRLALIYPF